MLKAKHSKIMALAVMVAMLLSFVPVFSVPVSAEAPVPENVVNIDTAGGTNYSLFNSGRTGSESKYSSTANCDEDSYTNGGYDLYAEDGTRVDTIRLGFGFKISTLNIENVDLNIYAYDVDETSGSGCEERDYIYLVDETTGDSVKLSGYMTGQNNTWNNSSFTIPAELLEYGHTYHLLLEVTCTRGCTHFWVYTRTVNLIVNGTGAVPPPPSTLDAELSASISASGLVSASLLANASVEDTYTLEYKAVSYSENAQRGGKEYSVTIPTVSTAFDTTFQLESGSPRGTYEITVFIKDGSGNVVATRSTNASYGYSAVSYNANGGSQNLPTDAATYSSGDTVTVLFNSVPSLYGYNFLGWSTDRNATVPEFTDGGNNTFVIGDTDVTLYAIWEEIPVVNSMIYVNAMTNPVILGQTFDVYVVAENCDPLKAIAIVPTFDASIFEIVSLEWINNTALLNTLEPEIAAMWQYATDINGDLFKFTFRANALTEGSLITADVYTQNGGPSPDTLPVTGSTVSVIECPHENIIYTAIDENQHTAVCTLCGHTETLDHIYADACDATCDCCG